MFDSEAIHARDHVSRPRLVVGDNFRQQLSRLFRSAERVSIGPISMDPVLSDWRGMLAVGFRRLGQIGDVVDCNWSDQYAVLACDSKSQTNGDVI